MSAPPTNVSTYSSSSIEPSSEPAMDGLNPPATGTPGANARVASRCIFKQFFKSILRRAWSESRPIPFVESTDVVSTAGTKRKVDEITEGEDLATTEAQPADDAMKNMRVKRVRFHVDVASPLYERSGSAPEDTIINNCIRYDGTWARKASRHKTHKQPTSLITPVGDTTDLMSGARVDSAKRMPLSRPSGHSMTTKLDRRDATRSTSNTGRYRIGNEEATKRRMYPQLYDYFANLDTCLNSGVWTRALDIRNVAREAAVAARMRTRRMAIARAPTPQTSSSRKSTERGVYSDLKHRSVTKDSVTTTSTSLHIQEPVGQTPDPESTAPRRKRKRHNDDVGSAGRPATTFKKTKIDRDSKEASIKIFLPPGCSWLGWRESEDGDMPKIEALVGQADKEFVRNFKVAFDAVVLWIDPRAIERQHRIIDKHVAKNQRTDDVQLSAGQGTDEVSKKHTADIIQRVEPFPSPVSVEQSSKATEDVPVKDAPANEEVTGTIITTPAVTDEQESADAGSQVIETIFPVPDSSNSAAVKLLPPAADKPLRSAADRYTKSDETSDKLREDHLSKGDINRVYAQHGSDRQKSSSSAAAHQATEISKTLIQNQGTGKFTSVIESKYSQASQLLASNIYPQYQHRASDTKSSQRLQVWPAATEAATDVESMEGVQEEKTIVEFPPPCNGITSRPQAIQQQYPPQNGLGTVESSLPKGCVHGSTQPLNDPTPPKAISTFGARTSQPVDMALFGASSNCHRLPGGFGASSGANLPTTYNQPEPMEIDHSSPSSTTITKDPFIDKTTAAQVDGINLNSDMASNTPDPTQLDPSAPKRIGNLDAIMDSILATRRYNPLRDTFDDGDDEDTASVVAQGINPSTSNHGRPKFTVPCKWFMRGLCRRGAACEYKHETGRTRPGMKDDTSIASPRAVKPPLMNSPAAPRSGHRNTAAPQSGQLGRAQRTPRNKSGNPSSNDRLAYSLPPRPSTYTNRDRLNNSMKQSGGFGAARSAPSSTRFSQSPLAQPSQATLYMQSNKPSSLKMRNHRNSKRSNDAHPAPYTAGTSMSTLPAHERHQNDRLNRDRRNSNGGDHRNTVENGFHDQKHPSKTRDNPPRRSQKSELSVGQDSRPREPQNKHDECGPHSVNKNKSSIAPSGPSQWQEKHSAAQPQGLNTSNPSRKPRATALDLWDD